MITVALARPWLIARLERQMRILSHAPFGAGYQNGACLAWREVRNADLPQDFPVDDWFAAELAHAPLRPGESLAAAMLTSCDLSGYRLHEAEAEGVKATALVTLGLSNAEAVGRRLPWHPAEYGTVNILVACDVALSEAAQLEALTIAVEARTAAILDLGLELATGRASGTGTDCTAIAVRPGEGRYAGLHTPAGEAIGRAVRSATSAAGAAWMGWREAMLTQKRLPSEQPA